MFKPLVIQFADVATLQRFQQNVQSAFAELDKPVALPVQDVISSATINTYQVKPTDEFLVVDSRGGPIKIILPAPSRIAQAVEILNAYTGNAVSIVQSDGKAMGDGIAAIGLPAGESAKMVNSGKAWWRFASP